MNDSKIICPYCFSPMKHDEVLFRATFGYTQKQLDEAENNEDITRQQLDDMRLFLRYDEKENRDSELMDFWATRGRSGYRKGKWDYPHIDPLDRERFMRMTISGAKGNRVAGEDHFVRDSSGFITQVLDLGNNLTAVTPRLCRNCHNQLPLQDYGKYPVIFISVVGITSAGKTVYLMQLLSKFATVLRKTGYTLGPNNLQDIQSTDNEMVAQNHPLPGSTDNAAMRHPLAVNVLHSDPSKSFTIVFYDIAGENCIPKEQDNERTVNFDAAHFVAYSDALMFLIDPKQLPGFSVDADAKMAQNIGSVINAVQGLRLALNIGDPDWDYVPVATVLTKSDQLSERMLPPEALQPTDKTVEGFNRDEFFKIQGELQERLESSNIWSVLSSFKMKGLFVVSAITCGVQNRIQKYHNEYVLNAENERLLRAAKAWISSDDPKRRGWNQRSAEDRAHYPPCPVRQKNPYGDGPGEPIVLPLDEDINQITGEKIVTQIYADNVDNLYERIYLSLWDVQNVMLQSYPMGDPNPRRIEDPLRWILWRTGRIGPYYQWVPMDPPGKKFLESDRKYKERQQQNEMLNRDNQQLFYTGSFEGDAV